jgi:hypothetical protein
MELKALTKRGITPEQFIEICKNSISSHDALQKCNLHRGTFTKYAKLLNCYYPNVGGKGIKRNVMRSRFSLEKWNNNESIILSRCSIKTSIIKYGLLPLCCNKCKLDSWNGLLIPLELNHINGEGYDNRKENIEFLCPNCHAQTDTYRGKNLIKKYGKSKKIINKDKQREYNKKPRKTNKWHRFNRNREQFLQELKQSNLEKIKIQSEKIRQSNIDFTQRGWRLKLAEILNTTPQHSGSFVQKHLPEIWEKCWKHNK